MISGKFTESFLTCATEKNYVFKHKRDFKQISVDSVHQTPKKIAQYFT